MDKNLKNFLTTLLKETFGGDGHFKTHEVFLGHMNDIYKISYADQLLGFRIRTHEPLTNIFGQRLMKEVFATWLLNEETNPIPPKRLQENFIRIKKMQTGKNLSNALVPHIIFFDQSQVELPFSCTLYQWIEGTCLWKTPHKNAGNHYAEAGKTLAQIHNVRLDSFYENIEAICQNKKQNWLEKYTSQMDLYLQRAKELLPEALLNKIKSKVKNLHLEPTNDCACLVHNDYSGGNIIITDDAARVIDWDVWEINRFEADLISQKYFTKIGKNGKLTPDPEGYKAFLEAYFLKAPDLAAAFNPHILRAEEIKWLLRLFLYFSSARSEISEKSETKTTSFISLYPSPDFFANHIKQLVE
ncbi:MAG: phosphotransferase family protein [Alphaproteobacteria bacterium]